MTLIRRVIMKNDLYETISNMTLFELIEAIQQGSISNKMSNSIIKNIEEESTTLYDTNELIEKYPFFTRYNLKKAIEEDNLSYIKIGNKRFFEKEAIEKWISHKNKIQRNKDYDF